MSLLLTAILLFGAGLALLLLSGDLLTRTSVRLSELFNINPLVAGLTITAFATSAPEAAVAVSAVLDGATDIALGNVIGSNTANILLVLGLPAIFAALNTNIPQLRRHLSLMLGASFLFLIFSLLGEIPRWAGALFLVLVALWVYYSFHSSAPLISDEVTEVAEESDVLTHAPWWLVALGAAGSALGLWGGATLTLNGATDLATHFQISPAVVGLTLIAIGTSLPELATSLAALWQKHGDIAIGNIVGSNLLNILFVLGISATIAPLPVARAFLQLDIPVMLSAALLLTPFVWLHKPLQRVLGIVFVSAYITYLVVLVELRPTITG